MRPAARIILSTALIAVGVLIGFGYGRWYGPTMEHDHDHDHAKDEKQKPKGYHCPMHPNFRSDKPGDCGICGMKLVPDEDSSAPPPEAAGQPATDAASSMPAGTIHISPQKQQLIGRQIR